MKNVEFDDERFRVAPACMLETGRGRGVLPDGALRIALAERVPKFPSDSSYFARTQVVELYFVINLVFVLMSKRRVV